MQSTLPKKYWSPSWSTIQLQSSSSRREDRWFTRGARERKGSRVRENKFLGWVVGWQAEHMQKMETENWCRNCKFSGDNSSTEEGIFLVHPSFLPLETSILLVFLRGSRLPPRQQDFFPPLVPTGGGGGGWMYLKIFSPSSVRFRGVPRRAVKSYRFVCVSPFRQASPGEDFRLES